LRQALSSYQAARATSWTDGVQTAAHEIAKTEAFQFMRQRKTQLQASFSL
jgi:hypothetical protein